MFAFDRSSVARLAGRADNVLERHYWRISGLFVLLFLAGSIARDLRTPMWLDELYTLHMAQQRNLAAIVEATLDHCDLQSPLYAMMVHSILPVVPQEALAVRLPATLGYCGMALFLLAFCRRRLPASYSLAVALLACDACLYYATEGRAYGLVLCCASGALVFWQLATEGRRRTLAIPLLALCLAVMAALHYYAIFFLAPLYLGELVRWRRTRRPDFAIASAALAALFALALQYPFIAAINPFQLQAAAWNQIPEFYAEYFLPLLRICPFALAALAIFSASRPDETSSGMPAHEWVAIGALALMPAVVVAVSIYTTHAFVDRHALWGVAGLAVLIGATVSAAARRQAVVGLTILGVLLAEVALHEFLFLHRPPVLRDGEVIHQELQTLAYSPEPIVIANRRVFLELSYYEKPRIRERLLCPVGWETASLTMEALGRHNPLHTIAFDALLTEHRRFVLAGTPADRLFQRLVTSGYRMTPVYSQVYEAESGN